LTVSSNENQKKKTCDKQKLQLKVINFRTRSYKHKFFTHKIFVAI